MFVRIVANSGSSRCVPSLSSASTTSRSLPVHCAPVPASETSPPTTKLGASPASARVSISIDVVVVLPCVPATATDRARAQIEASMPARRSVGIPSSTPWRSSMLLAGTAVDDVTRRSPRRGSGGARRGR